MTWFITQPISAEDSDTPHLEPVVEHVGVVDGDAFEESVELFGVDAV